MKTETPTLDPKLKHWEKRRDELANWLINHSYEHPDYEQNQRDYSHATLKVQQIDDHIDRVKHGPRNVGIEYAMPRQNTRVKY